MSASPISGLTTGLTTKQLTGYDPAATLRTAISGLTTKHLAAGYDPMVSVRTAISGLTTKHLAAGYDPMVSVRTAISGLTTGLTTKQLTGYDPAATLRTAISGLTTGITAEQLAGFAFDAASRLASSESGEVDTTGELNPDLVGWIVFAFVVVVLLTFWLNDMNAKGVSVADLSSWDLVMNGGGICSMAWYARSKSRCVAQLWNRGLGH